MILIAMFQFMHSYSIAVEKDKYLPDQSSKKELKLKLATLETRNWLLNNSIHNNEAYTFDTEIAYINEQYNSIIDKPTWQTKNSLHKTSKNPISSQFGLRIHPITGLNDFHTGIDIKMKTGNPVYCLKDGIVDKAQSLGLGNNGKYIKIKHSDNEETYYLHLSNILVSAGDQVYGGDIVGYSGSTGRTTGPHLHFSFKRNGKFVNPLNNTETRCYIDSY